MSPVSGRSAPDVRRKIVFADGLAAGPKREEHVDTTVRALKGIVPRFPKISSQRGTVE